MNWKDFFTTIKSAKLFGNTTMPKIVIRLFEAAGTVQVFSEDAAKSWINGKRNCKASKYFPEGKLNNEAGAIRFFRNHPENKLKELQQLFEKVESDSPIDSKTDDMDIFCQSLVNQFLDLLAFERLDRANSTSSSPISESMGDISFLRNHHTEVSQNMVTESDSKLDVNIETDMFSQESPITSSQISIPKEFHTCLYCKKWKGNIQDAHESVDGIYGKCLLYQKEILSTNKRICEKFNPSYERIPVIPPNTDFLKISSIINNKHI